MTDNKKPGTDQDAMADEWAAALEEQEGSAAEDKSASSEKASSGPRRAEFESFLADDAPSAKGSKSKSTDVNLDVVLDIPVTISMEIGRTHIPIRNLLQLNQGSVVELDRLAGEPLDVFANGTLIAHGEVVVVNEKFGIRLTDVMSPTERVKKLR